MNLVCLFVSFGAYRVRVSVQNVKTGQFLHCATQYESIVPARRNMAPDVTSNNHMTENLGSKLLVTRPREDSDAQRWVVEVRQQLEVQQQLQLQCQRTVVVVATRTRRTRCCVG